MFSSDPIVRLDQVINQVVYYACLDLGCSLAGPVEPVEQFTVTCNGTEFCNFINDKLAERMKDERRYYSETGRNPPMTNKVTVSVDTPVVLITLTGWVPGGGFKYVHRIPIHSVRKQVVRRSDLK